jgi:phosphate transport system ATP-binding protein
MAMATHNMQQAARVADYTAFFRQGSSHKSGPTRKIMSNPSPRQTQDYITGRFGWTHRDLKTTGEGD